MLLADPEVIFSNAEHDDGQLGTLLPGIGFSVKDILIKPENTELNSLFNV